MNAKRIPTRSDDPVEWVCYFHRHIIPGLADAMPRECPYCGHPVAANFDVSRVNPEAGTADLYDPNTLWGRDANRWMFAILGKSIHATTREGEALWVQV